MAGAAGSTLPQGREPSDVQPPREPRFQGMSIPGYNMKLAAAKPRGDGKYLCFALFGHVFTGSTATPSFPSVFMHLNTV